MLNIKPVAKISLQKFGSVIYSFGNNQSLNSWYICNIKLKVQNMERNHAVWNVKELHKFYAKMNKQKKETLGTENRIVSRKTSVF